MRTCWLCKRGTNQIKKDIIKEKIKYDLYHPPKNRGILLKRRLPGTIRQVTLCIVCYEVIKEIGEQFWNQKIKKPAILNTITKKIVMKNLKIQWRRNRRK